MFKSIKYISPVLIWLLISSAGIDVQAAGQGKQAALKTDSNANHANKANNVNNVNHYANIGRAATTNEIAAWDIDVRPDWQGLPPGSGSVAQGQEVWDQQCASCHGTFGESNQVFPPIAGGTTAADINAGRVAALANNSQPQRTTLMKLATLSTLWDYIRRAMPWNAPKTLSNDQVYAVTAYILNLGDIVPENFVLNQDTIKQVRLPNRNGLSSAHGLWRVSGKADVINLPCMRDCKSAATLSSSLPDNARNAHGNLALQHRSFGPVRGVDTSVARGTKGETSSSPGSSASPARVVSPADLAQKYACLACHHQQDKMIGPNFSSIASKYQASQTDPATISRLTEKLKQGGSGVWGDVPMPPQKHIRDEDLIGMLQWILNGAK
jgi:S-disulfanyl-L-cysteine oxidoreductase SoxD